MLAAEVALPEAIAEHNSGRGAAGLVILPTEETASYGLDLQRREDLTAYYQRGRTAGLRALADAQPLARPSEHARESLLMGADLFPKWIADVIVVEREEKSAVSVADLNPG